MTFQTLDSRGINRGGGGNDVRYDKGWNREESRNGGRDKAEGQEAWASYRSGTGVTGGLGDRNLMCAETAGDTTVAAVVLV